MGDMPFNVWKPEGGAPIKAWTKHVPPIEDSAVQQLENCASMPFIHKHIACMPDVHMGYGATVGSVIPTKGAIIPAAVGVDIGCGMMAVKTGLRADQLPDNLSGVRSAIEAAVPHGRSHDGAQANDKGGWKGEVPDHVATIWKVIKPALREMQDKHWRLSGKRSHRNDVNHLGTLGTGNHFIEVCLDENDDVWVMLHSGSRGIGNRIGTYFTKLAKEDMKKWFINVPDQDLAYFPTGTEHFNDYMKAVSWAQNYARLNRQIMMGHTIDAIERELDIDIDLDVVGMAVNCHHNYVAEETHFGEKCLVTRKGAVRAQEGDLGIIPGSMGARSYIVRGKGNKQAFNSCSHGAGRVMSRTEARKTISLEQHIEATKGVECRKDEDVIDESPGAYKDIDAVMASQADLVDVVHTLKQVVCVKG